MQAMSDTETPQGVLATLPLPDVRPPEDFAFALVSDAVSDPGNLGTIMRAAAAAAVPLLIVASGTVDPFNPKVVRSAMGAHFRLPVERLSWDGIRERLAGRAIFLADIGDIAAMNEVWDAWVAPGHAPPRATVQAALADAAWRIEVVVTAAQRAA